MADRPIIFSAGMVHALLSGRKTQHRVPLKPQPGAVSFIGGVAVLCCEDGYAVAGQTKPQPMPYAVGDRLWCREVWGLGVSDHGNCPRYHATMDYRCGDKIRSHHEGPFTWRSPVTMPRWASRLTLIVTDVRIQRVQDISEADAQAEGLQPYKFPGPWWQGYRDDGDGDLVQQQCVGETPPDWMIEPRRMKDASHLDRSAVHLFTTLWNSIHGPDAWDANPWVAALTFTTHRQNIDQMEPTNGN